MVTLRLDDGEELPFIVDTGATGTVLDKSLEPKLGKRLGTGTTAGWSGVKGKTAFYAAPRLYLGNTPLMTGGKVWIGDYGHPSGILGMDCLKHYCIQLDFEAGKMRFLDPDHTNAAGMGKAFPLTFRGNLPLIHHVGIYGGSNTNLLIDAGCRIDGLGEKNAIKGLALVLPEYVWDGEACTNLIVAAVGQANVLGLGFLARHLVTLDFPNRTLYLKQTRAGPLAGGISMETTDGESRTLAEFPEGLKEKGRLPGLSKDDTGATCLEAYASFGPQTGNGKGVDYVRAFFNSDHKSATFGFQKNGGSSLYHYTVARASKDSPWQLQKAWRTDENGHTIEEFPVP